MNQTTENTLRALADDKRLRIIAALESYPELCGYQLNELLGIAGATTSRHLSVLHKAQIILSRHEGKFIYYRLNHLTELSPLLEWLVPQLKKESFYKDDQQKLKTIASLDMVSLCQKQRGPRCCA